MRHKFINFPQHPEFTPMFNPLEMIEAGIFCGRPALTTPQMVNPRLAPIPAKYYNSPGLNPSINKYDNSMDATNIDTDRATWFRWYFSYYMDRNVRKGNQSENYKFIAYWRNTILEICDSSRIFTNTKKQHLLELGWHWEADPRTLIYVPKTDVAWIKVTSSNIEALYHDDSTLKVKFCDGKVYTYNPVPKAVLDELLTAESVGKKFRELVIANKDLNYRRIE